MISYPGDLHYFITNLLFGLGKYGDRVWAGSGLFFVSLLILLALSNFYSDRYPSGDRHPKFLHSETFFLLTVFLFIFILRLPNLILSELNPDESERIAGAATLFKDFRFWLSVDGTTIGPLVFFPLTLINVFGGTLNYASARLFGLLFCVIPSVVLIYLAFKCLFDEKISKIIILPLAGCMSFVNFWDLIAYNSEHLPMVMISMSLFLFCRGITISKKKQHVYLFLLGLILGLIPYAKLQSAPIALGMAIFCGVDLLLAYRNEKRKAARLLTMLVIGGLLPSILVLSYLLLFGIFGDFWRSYILSNLAFARTGLSKAEANWFNRFSILPLLIWATPDTKFYFISLFISALGSSFVLFRWRSSLTSIDFRLASLSFALVLISYYSVIQPGNFFHHYQILFIIPGLFLSGTLIGILHQRRKWSIRLQSLFLIGFISITTVFPSFYALSKGSLGMGTVNAYRRYLKEYGFERTYELMEKKSEIAKMISEYAKPNERMAIWGWMNAFYVETGLIQGTRESHSLRQISRIKQQEYYLRRYVSDIMRNKPVVFVDAVGPKSFYFNDSAQRHENFPVVKAIIDSRYRFVAEVDGVRIYRLIGHNL